jgi:SAM-dependent methyltransferase
MNYCEFANRKMYARWGKGKTLAIGEKRGQFDDSLTVDIEGADIVADLSYGLHLDEYGFDTIRAGEILEHLTNDADILRDIKNHMADDGVLIVTVPYSGEADYHVRLHNKWSIHQLLRASGFEVISYVPRKAQCISLIIWMLRGIFGQRVNDLFYAINPYLPWQPNGAYLLCQKAEALNLAEINKMEFAT